MKLKTQHILSFYLIGIFLLPNALNIFHFAWVDHGNSDSICSSTSGFQNVHHDHNCEQFYFKNPPITEYSFEYEATSLLPLEENWNEIKHSPSLYQFDEFHLKKPRGPPHFYHHSNTTLTLS